MEFSDGAGDCDDPTGVLPPPPATDAEWPEVTLLICAWNEEAEVERKMHNCRQLAYAPGRLHIVWCTDGSTDRTNDLLALYPDARVLFEPERRGKTAALNRAMQHIETPIVVFTDANTRLNPEAIREMVRAFRDPTAWRREVRGPIGATNRR